MAPAFQKGTGDDAPIKPSIETVVEPNPNPIEVVEIDQILEYKLHYCRYLLESARRGGYLPLIDHETLEIKHDTILTDPRINSIPNEIVTIYVDALQSKIKDLKKRNGQLFAEILKADDTLANINKAKAEGFIPENLISIETSFPDVDSKTLEEDIKVFKVQCLEYVRNAWVKGIEVLHEDFKTFKATCLQQFIPFLRKCNILESKAVLRALYFKLLDTFHAQEIQIRLRDNIKKMKQQKLKEEVKKKEEKMLQLQAVLQDEKKIKDLSPELKSELERHMKEGAKVSEPNTSAPKHAHHKKKRKARRGAV
eukprot:491541-Amorphochlora_amoeboformis.AAC.1